METTQRDRDSLREAQRRIHSEPSFIIGNLVEHKIQDPAKYKTLSRQEQGLTKDARPSLPKVEYKSKYLSIEGQAAEKEQPNSDMSSNPDSDGLLLTPEQAQANLWLNMDRVEFDKLEWMSEKAEKEFQEKLKATTHFDSQGKAIQPHENVQDQEVHDIGSLVKLLDSTFQPQITYALNIVSKIATRATIGLYDAVFDENIHQVLINECLLRVRHHIDSPNESICQSALKCLKALICNTQVDEIFIDKLYPLKSEDFDPTMWLMLNQENFADDMKDSECVALDAILALISRTDIFRRFKYLLCTKINPKFSRTYYDCILDLLIRFARYSRGVCWILNADDFPKILINLFLPADIVLKDKLDRSLALRTLKFLRILAQGSGELRHIDCRPNGEELRFTDVIVPTINTYYHIDFRREQHDPDELDELKRQDDSDDLLFKIHIETIRLMKSLLALDEFKSHVFSSLSLNPAALVENVTGLIRLSASSEIKSPSSLDWQFAAALIDLMGSLMEYERYNSSSIFFRTMWGTYIRPQVMQWISDLLRETMVPHQDISIAIAVAVRQFDRCKEEKSIADLHTLILEKFRKSDMTNLSLKYFNHLVREASLGNQLSSFLRTSGRLRDPVMLPSYGCMNLNTSDRYEYRLGSFLSPRTPYIMLNLYFTVLQKARTRLDDSLKHYINNIDLVRYMRSAACYYKYPVNYEVSIQQSILAQQEICILSNACLFLSRYYLSGTEIDNDPEPNMEPLETARTRRECYSHLVTDTISVIGLINPEIAHMGDLKDRLLEKILLNETMHARLMRDSRRSADKSYENFQYDRTVRKGQHQTYRTGSFMNESIDLSHLRSVYLCCEQPGRFWVFQPFIEYHHDRINGQINLEDDKWFMRNINRHMNGRPLPANCTDMDVIGCLLEFNTVIMRHSPSYFQLAVKPNIEEHLCLFGSVFLHDNLFLDQLISYPLAYSLEIILREGLRHGVDRVFTDASQKIVSLGMTLMDFFNKLVDQYEAASYNDITFTNFILLFMTPKCDKAFKRVLFSDKAETCLRQIRLGNEELWIPEEMIVRDKESDQEIKSLIKRSAPYTNRSGFLDYYRRYHS